MSRNAIICHKVHLYGMQRTISLVAKNTIRKHRQLYNNNKKNSEIYESLHSYNIPMFGQKQTNKRTHKQSQMYSLIDVTTIHRQILITANVC